MTERLHLPVGELNRGQPILEVTDLRIDRRRGNSTATIVERFSMALGAGETIGIVGESGSGKTITARAITGLLPPNFVARGEVRYGGRNLLTAPERAWRAVRGREIGLILQDPFTMLNPVMRCGRIITESMLLRTSRRERRGSAARRLREVGIHEESVLDRFPFQLSGGMRQRVAIAAALARDPRILIADEPSTALDVTTQREILALMKEIQDARAMSLILITHDLRVAFAMCDRIYVLYAGSLVEVSRPHALETDPAHPYSHALLLSEPPADRRVDELIAIPGNVPAPDEVGGMCPFAPRCRWAAEICWREAPPLLPIDDDRLTACVRIAEIRDEMRAIAVRADVAKRITPERGRFQPLIRVTDVGKVFDNGGRRVAALTDVTVEVGENESVGVVGESGSGKTTLARILTGLERVSAGTIEIDGIDASDWTKLSRRDRQHLRRSVQIVFQDPYSSLNPRRTIGWTLLEAVRMRDPNVRKASQEVSELLTSVGLPDTYLVRKPVALSGGERQRVAIARALALRPRVLICDEPVSALDVSVQAQILNLFATLRRDRGIGYLFITHDLAIVRQVVDRIYVMYRGRVVESGHADDVLANPRDPYTAKLLESVPRPEREWLVRSGGYLDLEERLDRVDDAVVAVDDGDEPPSVERRAGM